MMKGVRSQSQIDPQSDPPLGLSAGPFELHDQAGDAVDFRFSLFCNGEVAALLNVALIPHNWRKEKEFAAFIVKAVNAHDALADALNDVFVFDVGDQMFIGVRVNGRGVWSAPIDVNGRDMFSTWAASREAALAKLSEGLPTDAARDEVSRP